MTGKLENIEYIWLDLQISPASLPLLKYLLPGQRWAKLLEGKVSTNMTT
jgi:hypothetical protein